MKYTKKKINVCLNVLFREKFSTINSNWNILMDKFHCIENHLYHICDDNYRDDKLKRKGRRYLFNIVYEN